MIQFKPVQTDATLSANNSQHCWMLRVVSVSTPCRMLLIVVAQGLKPVKLLAPCKRTQHLLANNSQHFREFLRPFACSFSFRISSCRQGQLLLIVHYSLIQSNVFLFLPIPRRSDESDQTPFENHPSATHIKTG